MDLPVLKYLDVLIGFVLVMILVGTVVATITQVFSNLAHSRGRYLCAGLKILLKQVDGTNLGPVAGRISEAILRHPLIGKPNPMVLFVRPVASLPRVRWLALKIWTYFGRTAPRLPDRNRGGVIKREELIRILLEVAGGDEPVAQNLRQAFGFNGAADAVTVRKAIETKSLELENSNANEAGHVRETKAIVEGISVAAAGPGVNWGPNTAALVSRITAWFDQTMDRVTQAYAFEAKMATAVISLVVVAAIQLDSLDLIRRLSTDDKMRAALVQRAQEQEKKIEQSQTAHPPVAAAAQTAAVQTGAAADDVQLLKKSKEEIEASVADLNQPNLAILNQFFDASTAPAPRLPSSQFQLGAGTKSYRLTRNENEGFSELAGKINALNAGVSASARRAAHQAGYILAIQSLLPNVKLLELRADPDGINLMRGSKSLYAQSAEATSPPLTTLEPGPYRLNLGYKSVDLTVREKQTVAELAKAINALHLEVSARTADAATCKDCVLVLTAVTPGITPVKLLTDGGKTDLIKTITTSDPNSSLAYTDKMPFPRTRDFRLVVGTKQYPPIVLNEKDGFPQLAEAINAWKPEVWKSDVQDVRAALANVSGEECKECYVLTLTAHAPNVEDIGLRKHIGGVNLLGPVRSYYPWWNLGKIWKGIFLSWILLSLGSPFWYDMLKNLLRLRPMLAKQEESERGDRQKAQ